MDILFLVEAEIVFRNTNVKIIGQSVKQMCIAKIIYVLQELEHVLVVVMDAFIHIVWLIFRKERGVFICLCTAPTRFIGF